MAIGITQAAFDVRGNLLRHAELAALREDKDPKEVLREVIA